MYASRPSRIALGLLLGVAVWSHFSRPGRAFQLQLHAEFGMAAGVGGTGWTGQVRPDRRVIEGHCGRVVLLARAVVRDLMMTSLCVQVPRDTERPPGRPEFHLVRVISVEDSRIAIEMYCSCSHTVNTTCFGHHRCESLDYRDVARARTGQPGA